LLDNGYITATQLPHPSLFISKDILAKINPPFDATYRISADLKQQLIMANKLRAHGYYLPCALAKMRLGGASTLDYKAYFLGWVESVRAWNEVHGGGGLVYVIKKIIKALSEVVKSGGLIHVLRKFFKA
jgi:hypothetical protein